MLLDGYYHREGIVVTWDTIPGFYVGLHREYTCILAVIATAIAIAIGILVTIISIPIAIPIETPSILSSPVTTSA